MSTASIIFAIITILVIILIHELGHFTVAKLCKVKVVRFSIGFGKTLLSYTSKAGTEYRLALLPLGGYVKMLGDDGAYQLSVAELSQAYDHQPVYKRMAIVIAGPITNFLLAVLLFWVVFMHGIVHYAPVVGTVLSNSIAAKAGLQANDEIIKVNQQVTSNWQQVLMAIVKKSGDENGMTVTVRRALQNKSLTLPLKTWVLDKKSPKFLYSLGIVPYQPVWPARVYRVLPKTAAAKFGLRRDDKIVAINGEQVTDMLMLNRFIQRHARQKITLTIRRQQQQLKLTAVVGVRKLNDKEVGFLGFEAYPPKWPKWMARRVNFSPWAAILPAVKQTWALTEFNLIVLGKLIVGKISLYSLGGPISIVQMASTASQAGWLIYVSFVAFISVTIGFINLLPIPGLDGGHMLYLVIEAIRRKPVSMRVQMWGFKLGLFILLFLMLHATINDLLRLF